MSKGYVYFICAQVGEALICKIGYTGRHPQDRLNDLQPCSPVDMDIWGYFAGDVALERRFHQIFAPLRIHGEWFHATGKLGDFVHYLAGYGAARRPCTQAELDAAIHDCVLADIVPHPSLDHDEYMGSVSEDSIPGEWRALLESIDEAGGE